jgi:hypothetical protein
MIYEIGDVLRVSSARRDYRGSLRFALRNFAHRTFGEQVIELRLRHLQHFWNCDCHMFSFRLAR